MTNQDRSEELADWIHAVGRWKSRHRRLKNLLTGIDQCLREREELLEEALFLQVTARTRDEVKEADLALSKTVAAAQRDHEQVVRELADIYNRLQATDLSGLFERPALQDPGPVDDPVQEAGRESFPASDPPSFNPG